MSRNLPGGFKERDRVIFCVATHLLNARLDARQPTRAGVLEFN